MLIIACYQHLASLVTKDNLTKLPCFDRADNGILPLSFAIYPGGMIKHWPVSVIMETSKSDPPATAGACLDA